MRQPKKALEVADEIKALGTSFFKKADYSHALSKWQKAVRYVLIHPVTPESHPESEAIEKQRNDLFTSLQLNIALVALKVTPTSSALQDVAIKEANSILARTEAVSLLDAPSDVFETVPETTKATVAKAFYRRAVAFATGKRFEDALKDLDSALHFAPVDLGIKNERRAVMAKMDQRRKAQRAAYSKMFSK